jgi:glycosyltransferase involved in cell wall biosynthesis
LKEKIDISLTLVGSIDKRYERYLHNKYKDLFTDNIVIYKGLKDLGSLYSEMKKCDIFIMPSKHYGEGHSNAVNEAMYAALPLIVSNQGFLPDIVDASNAVVLERVDTDAIVNAVMSLWENRNRLSMMGNKSRSKVIDNFSDEIVLNKLARIYDSI